MSRVVDIPSKKLGEYMLKGWVLTDEQCRSSPDCPIPLMRAPDGSKYICVVHDDIEGKVSDAQRNGSPLASAASAGTNSHPTSRATTPATDPEASAEDFLPPPSQEAIRRREQSDLAANRIGERMLKGWAMLADECPNETCFGVPLVRPPRKDNLKDEKKECVICGNVYIQSKDARGFTTLELVQNTATPPQHVVSASSSSNPATHVSVNPPNENKDKKGKGKAPESTTTVTPLTHTATQPPSQVSQLPSSSLAATVSSSLESSLRSLSAKLDLLSGMDPGLVDPMRIGQVANQMTIVMTALEGAKRL